MGNGQTAAAAREPGCRLQSGVPGLPKPPPASRPAKARATGIHTPHASPRPGVSTLPEDTRPHPRVQTTPGSRAHAPRAGDTTYPVTGRAHRGPRTAAASCQTWSRPGGPARAADQAPDSRVPARGWLWPRAIAPPSQGSTDEGEQGPGGALTVSNGARDPSPRRSRNLSVEAKTGVSAAAAPWPQALLGQARPALAVRWPYPGPRSNRRGVRTRALRMRTGEEEGRGLRPSRRAARDPPARGLTS